VGNAALDWKQHLAHATGLTRLGPRSPPQRGGVALTSEFAPSRREFCALIRVAAPLMVARGPHIGSRRECPRTTPWGYALTPAGYRFWTHEAGVFA
jgi:hypothetical protein